MAHLVNAQLKRWKARWVENGWDDDEAVANLRTTPDAYMAYNNMYSPSGDNTRERHRDDNFFGDGISKEDFHILVPDDPGSDIDIDDIDDPDDSDSDISTPDSPPSPLVEPFAPSPVSSPESSPESPTGPQPTSFGDDGIDYSKNEEKYDSETLDIYGENITSTNKGKGKAPFVRQYAERDDPNTNMNIFNERITSTNKGKSKPYYMKARKLTPPTPPPRKTMNEMSDMIASRIKTRDPVYKKPKRRPSLRNDIFVGDGEECPPDRCFKTKSNKCIAPNSWIVFLKTHKGLLTKTMLKSVYHGTFLNPEFQKLSKKEKTSKLCSILSRYETNTDGNIRKTVKSILKSYDITSRKITKRPPVAHPSKKRVMVPIIPTVKFVKSKKTNKTRKPRGVVESSKEKRGREYGDLNSLDEPLVLQAHQSKVVNWMKELAMQTVDPNKTPDTKGLVVAHGTGSGKTYTALSVISAVLDIDSNVKNVNIFTPKSVQREFNTRKKHLLTKDQASSTRVLTHNALSENGDGKNTKVYNWKDSFMIVDESHLLSEKGYKKLEKSGARYIMFMSATPTPNNPDEIVKMINILHVDKKKRLYHGILNNDHNAHEWRDSTIGKKIEFLKNKVSVYRLNRDYMSFLKPKPKSEDDLLVYGWDADIGFPKFSVSSVKVPLSESQTKRYRFLQFPNQAANHQDEENSESKMNAFFSKERNIVNMYSSGDIPSDKGARYHKMPTPVTPKIFKVAQEAVKDVTRYSNGKRPHSSGGRVVIYAEYSNSINALEKTILHLAKEHYNSPNVKTRPFSVGVYTGSSKRSSNISGSKSMRKDVIQDFNDGNIEVLIISNAASTGIDLRCVSKILIVDLHYNMARMNQVIGRGIRYQSHTLPCDHNEVNIEIYVSSSLEMDGHKKLELYDQKILEIATSKQKEITKSLKTIFKNAQI